VTDVRSRRAVILFLLLLSVLVLVRAIRGVEGATGADVVHASIPRPTRGGDAGRGTDAGRAAATPSGHIGLRLEESGELLIAGGVAHRTLVVEGLRPSSGDIDIDWETRLGGVALARGSHSMSAHRGGVSKLILALQLPEVPIPSGLDLRVTARDAGAAIGEARFPFTVYPAARGRAIAALIAGARVALFDPEGRAREPLRALGLQPEIVDSYPGLTLYEGDLIIVGPGGFARGYEELGPVLAARARAGMRILLLDQPSLPGTLSEELRVWPTFSLSHGTEVMFAPGHPVLDGLPAAEGAAYLEQAGGRVRPLFPPAHGNFQVLAELRVPRGPSWQTGVALLEMTLGQGTVLAAQSSLCADFERDARARVLLANAVAYLLAGRPPRPAAFRYAGSVDDLPSCLAGLRPTLPVAPADLRGVDILVVPGDWRAPRGRDDAGDAPLAEVARWLEAGGTMILLNPQPLVTGYLNGVTGATAYFETAPEGTAVRTAGPADLLQGIAADDLGMLASPGRAEMRLRPRSGPAAVTSLLIGPGLARYRVGRGTLIAMSFPDGRECRAPRTASVVARLLTNLGIPLDQPPGIDPTAITRLDE